MGALLREWKDALASEASAHKVVAATAETKCKAVSWYYHRPANPSPTNILINSTPLGDDEDNEERRIRLASLIGAALISSARGNGTRWNPAGSFHPSSSTGLFYTHSLSLSSASNRTHTTPTKKESGGEGGTHLGQESTEVRRCVAPREASTIPIFGRASMDSRSVLRVRLLPVYACGAHQRARRVVREHGC